MDFFRIDEINSFRLHDIVVNTDHMTFYAAKRKNDQYPQSIKVVVLAGDVRCAWPVPHFLSFFPCGVFGRFFLASLPRLLVFLYFWISLACRDL